MGTPRISENKYRLEFRIVRYRILAHTIRSRDEKYLEVKAKLTASMLKLLLEKTGTLHPKEKSFWTKNSFSIYQENTKPLKCSSF